jgi:hypothetical protein
MELPEYIVAINPKDFRLAAIYKLDAEHAAYREVATGDREEIKALWNILEGPCDGA